MRIAEKEPRTAEFFDALFDADDLIEVRRFPSKKQDWVVASQLHLLDVGHGEDVYFGANPRRARGGSKADDVLLARSVFVDFDHVSEAGQVEELIRNADLPAPTAVLLSGRGVHCYWRLTEPMHDMAAWSAVQRGLIRALGTDKAIHDPPRIMRVPGSINTKNGHAAGVVTIRDAWYDLGEFPVADAREPRADASPSGKTPENISRRTLLFMRNGAPDGTRNAELFAAACDLAGCGYQLSDIERELVPAAERCGLDRREAETAIRSACSKMRIPARPAAVDPESVWGAPAAVGAGGDRRGSAGIGGDRSPQPAAPPATLPPVSNVFESFEEKIVKAKDGGTTAKVEKRLIYKSAPLVAGEICAATGGWPKLVGDRPFIMVGDGLGQRPHLFRGASDLFGWLHGSAGVFWTDRACFDRATGGERSAIGKSEVYEFFRIAPEAERYSSVSVYPHHPPIGGLYYPKINLPEPTGEKLREFIDRLNPDTDDDRALLTAMILTPGAGLAPGTRPLFVLTSDCGQGAGKTATARAISDIWGGSCDLDFTEDWSDLSKRIMSSDDAFARVMLFDNVKGSVFGTGTLEAAITAKTITGWRSYVGQVSRPNDATFIVTFNDPALTRDLTERAVVVKIGKQRHRFDFVSWAAEFVVANRPQLIADALGMLRAEPAWRIGDGADRFQAWQAAVLTRIPGAERLSGLIVDRRAAVDADYDAANDLACAIEDWCKANDAEQITGVELHGVMVAAKMWVDERDCSDAQNKANSTKRAKRILSGRSILKNAVDPDHGTPIYRTVYPNGVRTRSVVFDVDRDGIKRMISSGIDNDLPI